MKNKAFRQLLMERNRWLRSLLAPLCALLLLAVLSWNISVSAAVSTAPHLKSSDDAAELILTIGRINATPWANVLGNRGGGDGHAEPPEPQPGNFVAFEFSSIEKPDVAAVNGFRYCDAVRHSHALRAGPPTEKQALT